MDDLRQEILTLERQLTHKKQHLFILRFYKLIKMTEKDLLDLGITNMKLCIFRTRWEIQYDHYTDKYDENYYNHGDDSNSEAYIYAKKSHIQFGLDKKYYIKNNNKPTRFKIYRNLRNELRLINMDYDIDLDLEEQYELIQKYIDDKCIPEWLALYIFMYLNINDWQDIHLINHLNIV